MLIRPSGRIRYLKVYWVQRYVQLACTSAAGDDGSFMDVRVVISGEARCEIFGIPLEVRVGCIPILMILLGRCDDT